MSPNKIDRANRSLLSPGATTNLRSVPGLSSSAMIKGADQFRSVIRCMVQTFEHGAA